MKKLLLKSALLSTLISASFANITTNVCTEIYSQSLKEKENIIDGRIDVAANSYFVVVGAALATEGVLGLAVSSGVVIGTPAAISALAGGASTLVMMGIELSKATEQEVDRSRFKELIQLQKEAESGDGALIRQIIEKAKKKDPSFNLNESEVSDLILAADKVGVGCSIKTVSVPDELHCKIKTGISDKSQMVCAEKKINTLDKYIPVSKMDELVISLSKK